VIETDEEVQVIAEMPGVNKEDIELNATERELEIKAESENRRYYERVELPCEVIPDSAKARYNNGVLEVIFKKKYPEKKGKKIKVGSFLHSLFFGAIGQLLLSTFEPQRLGEYDEDQDRRIWIGSSIRRWVPT